MNISGIRVDHFGVWDDLKIDDLSRDINVFYGPNEAGKSTLMQFVRAVLFGFSADRVDRFITGPLRRSRGRVGGSLRLSTHEGEFHIARFGNELLNSESPDELRVTTLDGARAGTYRLEGLLSGVDEAVFQNVFAIGLDEIQQLSTLSDTQAAQFLYSLSTGADRVSLVDVMRQLRAGRERLVGNEQQAGVLCQMFDRRNKYARKIESLADQTQQWAELKSASRKLGEEAERLEQRRHQLESKVRSAEIAVRMRPKWEKRQQAIAAIAALGTVRDLPEGLLGRLEAIAPRIEQREKELEDLRRRRDELTRQADQIPVRESLTRHAARIGALNDQRKWIGSLDDSFLKLTSQIEETEFEMQAEQERLGIVTRNDESGASLGREIITALRDPARQLRRSKQQLEEAKRQASKYTSEAERLKSEIAQKLGKEVEWLDFKEGNAVADAVEKVGSVASDVRRQVELGRVVTELKGQLEELTKHRSQLLESQFLPRPVVIALGTLFALGVMSGTAAVFRAVSEPYRGVFLLVSAVLCAVSLMLKWMLEGTSRDDRRAADSKMTSLRSELDDARAETRRIEESLPASERNHAKRNSDAESKLGQLEKLLPLDEQRKLALEKAQKAELQMKQLAGSVQESRQIWQRTLQELGLSPQLAPSQIRNLIGNTGTMTSLRSKLRDLQEQRDLIQGELKSALGRIAELYAEAKMTVASERPLVQLDQLIEAMNAQKDLVDRRNGLRREARQVQREEERVANAIAQLQRKRASLIASAGVADELELRRTVEKQNKREQLAGERDRLYAEITSLFGNEIDERQTTEDLERYKPAELQDRLRQHQRDVSKINSQLKDLIHKKGELSQQIKSLEEDRSFGQAHLDLGVAQARLDRGLERWKVLSTMTGMLKNVYKRYEKDRQPHTLRQASEYLSRMTEGRYARIWTPLAEDVLLVDGVQGDAIPLGHLSRGTREQVFLSLRLALVADYARRGVRIPLVLDDVLVNYDIERSRAAAEVLLEFARAGHQMLVFTCHEHILKVFHDLGAEVRDLPRDWESDRLLRKKSVADSKGLNDKSAGRSRRLAAVGAAATAVPGDDYSAEPLDPSGLLMSALDAPNDSATEVRSAYDADDHTYQDNYPSDDEPTADELLSVGTFRDRSDRFHDDQEDSYDDEDAEAFGQSWSGTRDEHATSREWAEENEEDDSTSDLASARDMPTSLNVVDDLELTDDFAAVGTKSELDEAVVADVDEQDEETDEEGVDEDEEYDEELVDEDEEELDDEEDEDVGDESEEEYEDEEYEYVDVDEDEELAEDEEYEYVYVDEDGEELEDAEEGEDAEDEDGEVSEDGEEYEEEEYEEDDVEWISDEEDEEERGDEAA